MKNIKKLVLFITMLIVVGGVNVYAANIGTKLTSPEEGWKRYDDNAPEIMYTNCDTLNYNDHSYYNTYSGISSDSTLIPEINFKFYGTKLRYIGLSGIEDIRGNVKIIIDGVEYEFTQIGDLSYTPHTYDVSILQFEKLDLSEGIHTVKITRDAIYTGKSMWLDGIDIDEDGELLPPDTLEVPMNLTATASNTNIALNWDVVDGADSYTILRSTTSSAIDTVIASNVTETTYIDNNVEPGVTYYYVVRVVKNGSESKDSNVASAIIENTNTAVLQIKLSTTDVYEYRITMNEVDNFMKWYIDRADGAGLPFYSFSDESKIEPYTDINEYLIFDKIVWFKVKEYIK